MGCVNGTNNYEQGAVLTYLAIGISLFLMVVGYAIDVNRLITAHRQAQHLTRLASFAALEGYIQTECSENSTTAECENQKRAGARTRANLVLSKNKILGKSLEQISDSSTLQLVPGRYETETDVCIEEGANEAPCFRAATTGETVNAMQIAGPIGQITGTAFSRATLGFFSPTILTTSAEAALVPRRGCFVIDVSASTVRATFPLWQRARNPDGSIKVPAEPVCGQGHQFSFPLIQGFGDAGNSPPANPFDLEQTHFEQSVGYWEQWKWLRDNHWAAEGDVPHPSCTGEDRAHLGSDYGYKLTLGNSHYNSALADHGHPDPDAFPAPTDEGDWWLVSLRTTDPLNNAADFRVDSLQVIFEGLHKALSDFKARSVVGDKACIVFHDEGLYWPRIVDLTDDFDYLMELVQFGDLTGLSADSPLNPPDANTMTSTVGRERILHHGLFGHPSQNTDTYRALQYALNQFQLDTQSGGVPSADFVVLIGDGLHTCVNCINQDAYAHSSSMAWSCSDGNPVADCRRMYQAWDDGMKDIQKLVEEQFVPNEIPLNVILTGSQVRPHTVAIRKPGTSQCYSDYDWRAELSNQYTSTQPEYYSNLTNFVKVADAGKYTKDSADYHTAQAIAFRNSFGDSSNQNFAQYFYTASEPWYQFTAISRGVWGPIRPYNVNTCGADPASAGSNLTAKDTSGRSRLPCPAQNGDEDSSGNTRETFDPYCRTPTQQMAEYMEAIVGTTPFFLIGSN